ncbi:hypothetical protein BIV57_14335 [Mangrovactinospora gilvigrisea]|uniref:Uncharacterized protein n=1 Tax=Mangrovactinospora gilvigrisea TaxID=1428644 RepID=A0A1J7BDX1_9ACTN|nr:hypothetical protein [Mangrovactinospora gilvigrisea]OIV36838.1 hypothetical protein BIV57_14335 [Mangrovactinospora gilvigrisea]
MRQAFAHDALVAMEPDGDQRAPGAAITTALCGHWEHPPPCPLAPHHTAAERTGTGDGADVRLRILFAADPADEAEVRTRIDSALAAGTGWRLRTAGPGRVRENEAAHADELIRA